MQKKIVSSGNNFVAKYFWYLDTAKGITTHKYIISLPKGGTCSIWLAPSKNPLVVFSQFDNQSILLKDFKELQELFLMCTSELCSMPIISGNDEMPKPKMQNLIFSVFGKYIARCIEEKYYQITSNANIICEVKRGIGKGCYVEQHAYYFLQANNEELLKLIDICKANIMNLGGSEYMANYQFKYTKTKESNGSYTIFVEDIDLRFSCKKEDDIEKLVNSSIEAHFKFLKENKECNIVDGIESGTNLHKQYISLEGIHSKIKPKYVADSFIKALIDGEFVYNQIIEDKGYCTLEFPIINSHYVLPKEIKSSSGKFHAKLLGLSYSIMNNEYSLVLTVELNKQSKGLNRILIEDAKELLELVKECENELINNLKNELI